MNYNDARSHIRSGDLLAWSHRECRSFYDLKIQVVRLFEKSEYSHVGVAWVVGGRVFVLEAVMPKIRIYPLSKAGDFFWLPMNAPWTVAAEEFALGEVGALYSQWQAVLAFFGKVKRDQFWYCDEYARAILSANGVELENELMPSGLVRAAQKRGSPLYFVSNQE